MSKTFLEKLNDFIDKEAGNENYEGQHIIIAVELNNDGSPSGAVTKIHAPPFTSLGLISYVYGVLDKLNENINDNIASHSSEHQEMPDNVFENIVQEKLKHMPNEFIDILSKYDSEIKDAIFSGNDAKLEELRKIILNELKEKLKSKGKDDIDDYNIDDFIGGGL